MEVQLHTFLFADISSYSVLTELEGDEAAADLAIAFSDEVARMARAHGASVVRRIGDGVMVHCFDAAQAIALGLRLVQTGGGQDGALPTVHAGVHTGPALARAGDWWGATVNVTARVAAAARAGELLVTDAARQAAGPGAHELSELGALSLKNISAPVPVYSSAARLTSRSSGGLLAPLADLRLRLRGLLEDVVDGSLSGQGFGADAT